MKKVLMLILFCSVFVLVTFLLFADFEQYVESNLLGIDNSLSFMGLSFIFLFSDILFPIPSSLIMMLNGKVLGVVLGTLLSFVAGITSSSLGYFLGKKSSKYLNRFFKEQEIEAGNAFFEKYGKWSVALSRAIPILSESISIVSGTTQMPFKRFLVFASIGQLVISLLYAYIGSAVINVNGHLVTVLIVLCTFFLTWIVAKWLGVRVQAI